MSLPRAAAPSTSLWPRARWALLGLATAAALALVAPGEGSVAGAAPGTTDRQPAAACAPAAAGHDPGERLGATLAALTRDAAHALGLADGTALLVQQVRPESPAARGGLRVNDVITAIAVPVSLGSAAGPTTSASRDALHEALDERLAGGALDFFVRRDGLTRIVHVKLEPHDPAVRAVADAPAQRETACI